MASSEKGIGIDLGTTKVMIYKEDEGIVVNEPSVVAYDADSGEPIAFGQQAYEMVGKTHKNIVAEYPLKDGVISNYSLTKEMVKYFINKAYESKVVKPKVSIQDLLHSGFWKKTLTLYPKSPILPAQI